MNKVQFPEEHRQMLEQMGMPPIFIGRDLTITQGKLIIPFNLPPYTGPAELKQNFRFKHYRFERKLLMSDSVPVEEEVAEDVEAEAKALAAHAADSLRPGSRPVHGEVVRGGEGGGPQPSSDTIVPGAESDIAVGVDDWIVDRKVQGFKTMTIPNGYYSTVPELINAINLALSLEPHIDGRMHLSMQQDQSVKVTVKDDEYRIQFDSGLESMLGLHPFYCNGKWISKPGTVEKGSGVELNGGLNFFMVYSDVGEMVRICNRVGRILRCISASGAGGSTGIHSQVSIAMHFPNVQYVPVSRNRIDNIRMSLYTDFGQLVHFTSGKTLVVLHFRRRYPLSSGSL
jgi:hypothetical protein